MSFRSRAVPSGLAVMLLVIGCTSQPSGGHGAARPVTSPSSGTDLPVDDASCTPNVDPFCHDYFDGYTPPTPPALTLSSNTSRPGQVLRFTGSSDCAGHGLGVYYRLAGDPAAEHVMHYVRSSSDPRHYSGSFLVPSTASPTLDVVAEADCGGGAVQVATATLTLQGG
jgi:hypothetical protein